MSRRLRQIDRDTLVVDPTWANWDKPVTVRISGRAAEEISNPAEALSFLSNRWDGVRDNEYLTSRKACSEVLRRRVTSEEAKLLFLKFASNAGVLVQTSS